MGGRRPAPDRGAGPQARRPAPPVRLAWRGGWLDGRAPCRDLGAARGAQLREDMRDVRRDCLGREHQLLRDLPVGEAGRDKLGDLEFACAERMPGLGLPRTLELSGDPADGIDDRSEEHTSELQSRRELVCRLLLEKKNWT